MADSEPKRIQRRRVKGWKMPPNVVYVGRLTKWGNPYTLGDGTRDDIIVMYRSHWWKKNGLWRFDISTLDEMDVRELRGKDLACFCRLDQPCHADVLLEMANG